MVDGIGDLPLAMRGKLLRVIQERSVQPVFPVPEAPVNVHIYAQDLSSEVAASRFRPNLLYHLRVVQIRGPPLRERLQDLGLISTRVLTRIAQNAGVSPALRLTPRA